MVTLFTIALSSWLLVNLLSLYDFIRDEMNKYSCRRTFDKHQEEIFKFNKEINKQILKELKEKELN